ncbi:MAG: PDZ domain-containing protein [Gammaproteobacteria bacterium]|nr:PDZ domain-containing protein [Gammaproteobacteria bacterium]
MSTANAVVRYCIQALSPQAHLFQVAVIIPQPDSAGQRVSLPAWIPGSYMIRDFARNVVQLHARSDGRALAVKKIDKQTWQVEPCAGELQLEYEVYAWDLSVRAAHLDQTHGYFNGTSVFVRVHGKEHEPCQVELLRPQGELYASWKVSTALRCDGATLHGFGTYQASDYDELIDHPVEMGNFTLLQFDACGVPHEVAITGRHYTDEARLIRDLQAICETQIRFFGEPAPFDRYVFQVMVVGEGYGGLEHRASTSLLCARDDLPRSGMKELTENYKNFLGLCSHEYFHAWNVKRIKPEAFIPYDLDREVYTELLWVFEGFTSYYDELFLYRAKILSDVNYLQMMAQGFTRVTRGSGRFKQSIAESSFDAWSKFYKQDENALNAIVSYYGKGAMVGLALDLWLRQHSAGQYSLDHAMRYLWQHHGLTGKGMAERSLEQIIVQTSGLDVSAFFADYVYGTQDPPMEELLNEVGVSYQLRATTGQSDTGGKAATVDDSAVTLGCRFGSDAVGAKVAVVQDGSAGQLAGLAAGDVLVAIDGLQVNTGNLEKRLANFLPGQTVQIHAFRRDELMTFSAVMKKPVADTCVMELKKDVAETVLANRQAWLNGA